MLQCGASNNGDATDIARESDTQGKTLLHLACELEENMGSVAIVKYLLMMKVGEMPLAYFDAFSPLLRMRTRAQYSITGGAQCEEPLPWHASAHCSCPAAPEGTPLSSSSYITMSCPISQRTRLQVCKLLLEHPRIDVQARHPTKPPLLHIFCASPIQKANERLYLRCLHLMRK